MHWSGPFLDYFDHIKRKSCLKNNTFKLQSKGIFSLVAQALPPSRKNEMKVLIHGAFVIFIKNTSNFAE